MRLLNPAHPSEHPSKNNQGEQSWLKLISSPPPAPQAAASGGRLSGWHPVDLAAQVLDALVERSGADPALVEDVIMGCVMQAGEQTDNIARNAVLASKLPKSVPGVTSVDRQCGSSQQALHFAAQAVMSGTMDCVIAAGVESMTRVPMGAAQASASEGRSGPLHEPGHPAALSRTSNSASSSAPR